MFATPGESTTITSIDKSLTGDFDILVALDPWLLGVSRSKTIGPYAGPRGEGVIMGSNRFEKPCATLMVLRFLWLFISPSFLISHVLFPGCLLSPSFYSL